MRRKLAWILAALMMVLAACGSNDSGGKPKGGFGISDDTGFGADAGDVAVDVSINPGAGIGQGCTDDSDCADGRCMTGDNFPGGYCTTTAACSDDSDCRIGTSCQTTADGSICGERCSSDSDCRNGYACESTDASPYRSCVVHTAPTGAVDGEACATDNDCQGGTCIPDPQWPGGYCTTLDCQTQDDCARGDQDNRCLRAGRRNLCVRMCQSQADCRDGYMCQQVGGGQGVCVPDDHVPAHIDDVASYPFDITCGLASQNGTVSIDYSIDPDTVAYMITPFTRDNQRLMPTNVDLPDGSQISFGGQNNFQTIPAQLFGFINPIITPVIDSFNDQLQSGDHTLTLRTDSQDVCYYLLQESSFGTTLDLNIYLVGVPGMDASTAADDPDMQKVLQGLGAIYAQAGVSVGDVHYLDITGQDADAYQVARSESDIQNLVALSKRPDGDYNRVLSANIFFIRSMQLGGGGGAGAAIGISEGIPGAAGLYGTPTSGVVFTSEYMGQQVQQRDGTTLDGDDLTSVVMAHEIGHYLGLFHTSEQGGQGYDPIDDTPQCTSGFPDGCPDLDNLMFPLAGTSHTKLSDGQIHTIKANPLTKE